MKEYQLVPDPDILGFRVELTDGTLIGYVDPTDDPNVWIALSVFDENFFEEVDSEDDAADKVWWAYHDRNNVFGNE